MKYKCIPCLLTASLQLSTYVMLSDRPPDLAFVQQVAQRTLQLTAVDVEPLNGSIVRIFRLHLSANVFYVLKCRSSVQTGLLRQEEGRLQAEAYVLQALQSQGQALIPRLITYKSDDGKSPIGNVYLISGPFRGTPLSDAESSLSRDALARVDCSVGQHVRRLSETIGPYFGPVHAAGRGYSSWSDFFHVLMEMALQDGEDALVSLPYDAIRIQIRRHRVSLAHIHEPRLVVLELMSEGNILVDPQTWQLSGLMDLSTAVWGDPFLSNCFYKPSAGLIEGFGKLPNGDVHEQVRQYCYIIYHSLLAILRSYYRPLEGSDEMEARRNLTVTLTHLSNIMT